MENGRFVVLTGHLNDYPLSDIIGILRHQRKTGRLLIDYPKGPAAFFFQEGDLIDAQLNNLSGLQAICVAVAQPPSPFNFNPLIASPRRSIETSLQRVVSELLGCWDENAVQIDADATERTLPKVERLAIPASTAAELTEANELAILPQAALLQQRQPTNRTVLTMAAAGLVMAGLSTVIAVTGGFRSRAEIGPSSHQSLESKDRPSNQPIVEPLANAPQNQSRKNSKIQTGMAKDKKPATDGEQSQAHENDSTAIKTHESVASPEPSMLAAGNATVAGVGSNKEKAKSEAQSVNVVMQIENGRVMKASIASHKAGMDSYEALALRIARQRRYPSKATGQQTVVITVAQPN
ncbi:MAG TPA: DUF4388 domain-containing protein [Pyrinomonadaceae bacterium]|jgi:hypothetical protein|nr:DUF4388 domain-containing protein [Pyrinomonadaceae bacterium]